MLLMHTSESSTLQSEIIYHRILYRILTQHFTTITFQLLLVMSAQKWVERILEMQRNHMLLQTFIILERNCLFFHFTQIHSKLVNCYSCSSGLTVCELVVHVTNPTFCANQIWQLYWKKFNFNPLHRHRLLVKHHPVALEVQLKHQPVPLQVAVPLEVVVPLL